MVLSLISLAAREGERVAVTFEIRNGEDRQRECFLIPASLVADLHLSVGEVDAELYDAVVHGAQVHTALRRGLGILGYGRSSEKILCRKLRMKGIRREIAEEAVAELLRQGYLNPREDALFEAEKCVQKLWGARRIGAALSEKGYDREAVGFALYSLEDEGVDYTELCAERIRRSGRGIPTDHDARQKLVASLLRYGFEAAEIREAIRTVAEEND